MEIKVVSRQGLCGTWTQIVSRFVLPSTTKGFPSYKWLSLMDSLCF
jgi:hypothetical protein